MKRTTWLGMALWLACTWASASTVVLTQTISQVPQTGLSCQDFSSTPPTSFWRAYDLSAMGLTAPLTITKVEFGVSIAQAHVAGATQPLTVNVYTSAGAFPGGTLTLQASQTLQLPNQLNTLVQVPLNTPTAPLPANSIVVLELAVPGAEAPIRNRFYVGVSRSGQTGPSYVSGPACNAGNVLATTPTTFAQLGFPTHSLILNAYDTTNSSLAEQLACASSAIAALPNSGLAPAAAKSRSTLLDLVNTATKYQAGSYWSLSLAATRSALVRTDGCTLRGSPDTTGDADLVTNCAAQAPIFACLKDAEKQLAVPRGK